MARGVPARGLRTLNPNPNPTRFKTGKTIKTSTHEGSGRVDLLWSTLYMGQTNLSQMAHFYFYFYFLTGGGQTIMLDLIHLAHLTSILVWIFENSF